MLIQLIYMRHILGLLPLFLLVRAVTLVVRPNTRRRTTPLHELGVIGFCLYLSCVCYITVNVRRILQGHFEMGYSYNLIPFAEITSIAAGSDTLYALLNIAGNVVMFFPLGFLLPLLWRGWGAGRTFFVSLFFSGGIEVLQLFTGRSADVDDVILNTLGGMIGFFVCCIVWAVHPGVAAKFHLQNKAAPSRRKTQNKLTKNALNCQARPNIISPVRPPIPQVDELSARHGPGFRRMAFITTVTALLALVSGTVLLAGLENFSVLTSPSVPSASRRQSDIAPIVQATLDVPGINSANILLASGDMSQILYEEKADQSIYPASLTKMMTAILVLESIVDLEEVIPLWEEIFTGIYEANLSTAGFQPGEMVRALDLVYGVMLPSGAECSIALAEHIAGSEEAFAMLMNQKARELGMNSTHFVNASGSHHKDHYTTARDMALLLSYALENPVFREMAAMDRYHTASTNLHPEGIVFASTLFGKTKQTVFSGGVLIGGKTGYTDEAGQCLASFAQIGGGEYILVTAGARPVDFRVEQLHIADAFTIYETLSEIEGAGVV